LFDLEPLRQVSFLQSDLQLTTDQVAKVSPVHIQAPLSGQLHCFVGSDESPEFIRQNALLQKAWGKKVVPTVAAVDARNHFSVLSSLTQQSGSAVHETVLGLLNK
jgi:arylformamidase